MKYAEDGCRPIRRESCDTLLLRSPRRSAARDRYLRGVARAPEQNWPRPPLSDAAARAVHGRGASTQACSIPVMRLMTATKSFQLFCFERRILRPLGVRL